MKNKIQILIGGMLALGLLNSCYPDDYGSIDDYTIVHTDYNVDYEFAGKGRIYMPDTIAFSTNIDEEDIEDFERWENKILDEVRLNFEERGYTLIDSAEAAADPPHMLALASGIVTKVQGGIWYPGWGWYYPPGWGGYYAYYTYTTGTISIMLADFESAGEDIEGVELEWMANINGLLNGIVDDKKIEDNIAQAFTQSPYINANEPR